MSKEFEKLKELEDSFKNNGSFICDITKCIKSNKDEYAGRSWNKGERIGITHKYGPKSLVDLCNEFIDAKEKLVKEVENIMTVPTPHLAEFNERKSKAVKNARLQISAAREFIDTFDAIRNDKNSTY